MFEQFKQELEKKAAAGEEGIPELIDFILRSALELNATDLHLECREQGAFLKLRMDGILHPVGIIQKELMLNAVARLKVMAKVKTFDRRSPQDGRIEFEDPAGARFLRVSFLPTLHGEKATVRFPDRSKISFELEELGMREEDLLRLNRFLEARQGALLLTGPISSGKTTTIYSILKRLVLESRDGLSISTLEDPIESPIEGVTQTQIDPVGGLSYATGLRMLLRQDTDVMVVGEIRDEETAHMAVRAGLIGHLVISTIHSPDASGVFTRLINMGMEPFLIASSVSAVVGQRLLRRLCTGCKKEHILTDREKGILKMAGEGETRIFRAGQCNACRRTGYRGRMGIFEVLYMSEKLRELILESPPTRLIRKRAGEEGMLPLSHHARTKVLEGETSLEEYIRVLVPV